MAIKSKHNCSNCGKSGHNKRTCPDLSKAKSLPQAEKVPETVEEAVGEVAKRITRLEDLPVLDHNFDLNTHMFRLMMGETFFAEVSRNVTKVENKSVQTAGVTVDPKTGNFLMLYNPDFFARLTPVQQLGVLKHELYHLSLGHCTGRKPTDASESMLWNIAADLAINSYLENELPEFCCLPGKGKFVNYAPKQAAELYYKQLKQDPEFSQSQSGEGEGNQSGQEQNGQFDSHEGWDQFSNGSGDGRGEQNGEASQIAREIAEEKLKNILRKAASAAMNGGNNWGTISAEMRSEILARIESKIDWRKVLRYFIKTSQRSDKTGTMRKINKRYAYIHPGRRQNRHANVLIAIDQSGSVDDGMLETFFAELSALSSVAEFTVLPFDSAVAEDKMYVWKKGTHKKAERVLCGGTDFNAPTKFANEHGKYDGLILLTDLCAPAPIPCKVQRLWITTEEHAKQPYFQTNERIIAVPRTKS